MAKYNKKKINPLRRRKISAKKSLQNETKSRWKTLLLERIRLYHKRNLDKIVAKLLSKAVNVRNAMEARSKKAGVKFDVDIEEIRAMIYNAYGTPCKYCGKPLTIKNMVFDHIHPISLGGESVRENLQVICKTSNAIKGSLSEEELTLLLNWLDTVPENLKKNILIRLARGFI